MLESSSKDQLDAGALSGEQASCIAALTTYEKYIRVCWHRGRFQRAVYRCTCRGSSQSLAGPAISPLLGTWSVYRKEVRG